MAIAIKKIEKWAQKKKVSKLLKALSSDNTEVRIAVIKALGTTNDENVMYTLIPFLKDSDPSIRAITVETLGTMGNGRSLEFVRQLWNSESDENVREKAKLAINAIKENMSKTEKH
jgi:HEAT repeat protein